MASPNRLPRRQRSAQEPSKLFDPSLLANAGIGRTLCDYNPKQIPFLQGERADAVLYIQEGTARRSVVSKHHKKAAISLLGCGDFLGRGMHRLGSAHTHNDGDRYYEVLGSEESKERDAPFAPRTT